MTTYISILRGINVSGQKLIKMEELRTSYENLGYQHVRTYVQSGNIIFSANDAEPDTLEHTIFQQIDKDFGFKVPVIVLTVEKLKHVINTNPFLKDANKDPAFFHVTFLASKPTHYDQQPIKDKAQSGEEVAFSEQTVYLYCPDGYGRTKLTNNFIEARLKVGATTRNWRTTNELLKLAEGIS